MATPPTIAVIGLGAAGTALAADLAGRGVPRILAHDVDLYGAWASAVVDGVVPHTPWTRKYAVGSAFLRGPGRGRVAAVTGVHETWEAVGKWVVEANLPTLGAAKSDSYEGDGYVVVRDPDTEVVKRALKTVVDTIRVHYAE